MRFVFNEKKAAQAAAHVLHRHGGRFNYMHLIKELYLADRQSLIDRGVPITGDSMFAMKHGPVLSNILDAVSHGPDADSEWARLISEPAGYAVSLLVSNPPDGALSEYEIEVLDTVDTEYGRMNVFELVELLHETLPEWDAPGLSSKPIDPETILSATRQPAAKIEQARQAAAETAFFHENTCPWCHQMV